VLIKPAEVVSAGTLDEIGKTLKAKGIKMEDFIERGREIREEASKSNTISLNRKLHEKAFHL
jgi:hypothetical protein